MTLALIMIRYCQINFKQEKKEFFSNIYWNVFTLTGGHYNGQSAVKWKVESYCLKEKG